MGVWSNEDFVIQASCRNDEQAALHLHHRQRRSADGTEAFTMSSSRQIEPPNSVCSCNPLQISNRGEQVGSVSRSCVLTAILTMAEVKALELAFYFEADLAAKAGTRISIA